MTEENSSNSLTLKFLVLIGNSGSGKSILGQKLAEAYPDIFQTTIQTTTRAKRENTYDPYVFVDEQQYTQLKPLLLGKTEIETSNGKTFYGTFLPVNTKYNIIVLNEKGLADFHRYFEVTGFDYHSIVIGLVNYNFQNIQNLPGRADRDNAFLQDEVDFTMGEANFVIDTTNSFASVSNIVQILGYNDEFDDMFDNDGDDD